MGVDAAVERFWSRVDRDGGECWLWLGRIKRGYGEFDVANRSVMAHRFAYEQMVGPIPDGLEIDHLCLVTACVNPAHLEPVTHDENMRRRYANVDRCVNGHPYDEANTYLKPSGHRDCRTCIRDRVRRYQTRRAA